MPVANAADAPCANQPEVARIAGLPVSSRIEALRAFLTKESFQNRYPGCLDSIFYYESQFRPALLLLVNNSRVSLDAVWYLTLIGVPEDMRAIIKSPPPAVGAWPSAVASSLLDAESDWAFLRRCALDTYPGNGPGRGAIQTLKLIASSQSRELLEEVKKHNPSRAREVTRALRYTRSNPLPLTAPDLEPFAARTARVLVIGDWDGNGPPRYNEAGDKALIDFRFTAPDGDGLTYTATFHRVGGVWKLRAVRETLQEFGVPRRASRANRLSIGGVTIVVRSGPVADRACC